MATEKDFNVPPYFDDFDANNRYHRILFRPSVAVQARELTQLQTTLQDQIETFGNHVFKDGSIVDGCAITYYPSVHYISVEDRFDTNVELFPTDLTANSDYRYLVTNSEDSENAVRALIFIAKTGAKNDPPNTNRFYFQYISTGTDADGNDVNRFAPGDTLYFYTQEQNRFSTLDPANLFDSIQTLASNSSFTSDGFAYCVSVSDGTIFQKGFFTKVQPHSITVRDFSTDVQDYVIGFDTEESIVDENIDDTLLDNALGYSNENAPGAHRLKLNPVLVSKTKDDVTNNKHFFAIVEFDNGSIPTEQNDNPQFTAISRSMAQRTYEESGDYVINPFQIETTPTSNAQSFYYEVSSGVGYVRGNRIDKISSSLLETPRAIDTASVSAEQITANFGNYVICNEFLGAFNTQQLTEVNLYSLPQRAMSQYEGVDAAVNGTLVGKANVRAIVFREGTKGRSDARYEVYLFNIRMNSGKTFSRDVKSIYYDGSALATAKIKADIVLENNLAILQDSSYSTSVFNTGYASVKSLTDQFGSTITNYEYTQISNSSISSAGSLTVTLNPATATVSTEKLTYSVDTYTSASVLNDFNIVFTQNAYSANLAGTINVQSTATTLSGTSTSFTDDLTANSLIRINTGGSYYLRRVVSVANSSQLTIDSPINVTNTTCNFQKYFVAGSPLPLDSIEVLNETSFTADIGLTLDSGSQTVICQYPVSRREARATPKTINKSVFVKIDCSNNVTTTAGPWNLGLVDVHKLRKVYVGTSSYSNTNDKTAWFGIDLGQTPDTYEHAKLFVKPEYASKITTSTRLFVELDHFTADTATSVGFFSIESYPIDDNNLANTNAIQTIDVPVFNNIDLKNHIDFRPRRPNSATSVSNSTPANTLITINPPANTTAFDIDSSGHFMINPDTRFTANYTYYLPRIDMLSLDISGNFIVNRGVPSTTPKPPYVETDQSLIAKVYIPPFPSITQRESATYKNTQPITLSIKTNRRYTMKDIGALDDRLKRVEYYTVLNALEQQAKNLTIPDANGLDRFKNGIFADPFNSHNNGDVGDLEYKIAIDAEEGVGRPIVNTHGIDLKLNTSESSNIIQIGPYVMLNFDNERFISQRYATKFRNACESVWQWNGALDLYPKYDFFRDVEETPNVTVNIDLTTPWTQFAANYNQVNYGQWRSLGTETSDWDLYNYFNGRGYAFWDYERTVSETFERTIREVQVNNLTQNYNLGSYVKDISIQPFMRSRLVAFVAYNMKPNTTLHAFFDSINVDAHCAPGALNEANFDTATAGKEDSYVSRTGNFGDPLVSNSLGFVCGIFKIPAGTFRTGDRVFQLTNVDSLVTGADAKITASSATFTADNLTVSKGSTAINVSQPRLNFTNRTEQYTSEKIETKRVVEYHRDPLAQSFEVPTIVDQDNKTIPGMFLSRVGVFFKTKDSSLGCSVVICEMTNNQPDTSKILARSYLPASSISVSENASVETVFQMDCPVYLLSNTQYAFVVMPDGNSSEYNIWTAETGGFDVASNSQVYANPYIGMMFTSANFNTWTAYQKEDIKFNIYRAKFRQTTGSFYASGSAMFENESDEYLTVDGITRSSQNLPISIGDVVFTVNSSITTITDAHIVSNTLVSAVSGRVQYIDEANGKLWLDGSTATSATTFSNNDIIAIYRPADTTSPTYTTSTLVAYANVVTVDNLKYHAASPSFGVMQPVRTQVAYDFKGTSNTFVVDSNYASTVNGREIEFVDYERIAMSRSNEIKSTNGRKSNKFRISMNTEACFLSPVINLSKKAIVLIENMINNDVTNEHTRYGNALTKYISKKVILADGQEAEDLQVYMTAYRPVGTDVKVYAKVLNNEDTEDFKSLKDWSLLEYKNSSDLVYSSITDRQNYIEYQLGFPSAPASTYAAFANSNVETTTAIPGGITVEQGNTVIIPKKHYFNANTAVNNTNETIAIANADTYFSVGDSISYNIEAGNTGLAALTTDYKYFVSFANSTHVALSESRTGANINLTASTTSESGHYLYGGFFTERFNVGDKIQIQDDVKFAIRTITNISNNTYMVVDKGLEQSNTSAIFYVYSKPSNDGIVEYENADGSRFIGFKTFALKVVLLSTNPIKVPKLNDIRAIALQV